MFSAESPSFSLSFSEINWYVGFEIIFFCLWLYYILSLCILQDFSLKNNKLFINFQIVLFNLDYLIIYEYLFVFYVTIYFVKFLSIPLFFCKLMV